MKSFAILFLALLFTTPIFAQSPSPEDEHAADRTALRQLGASYEQAINGGNLTSLAPSVAPDATAVFVTNDEVQGIEDMQKFFENIKERLGKGSSYTVKLQPDRTAFFGDIALAHGTSDELAKTGSGREFKFTTHWTAVLRKDAGQWKALRLQVTMDPFNNPAVAAQLQMRTWIAAGLGVVAAIVAFIIGRISAKKR
jgi:uncharacterized protein (TIGR02246 family)